MKTKKKIKKAVLSLAVAVGVILVYALTVNFYMIGSAQKSIVSREETAFIKNVDCVLVLGCGIRPDGSPSDMLRERIKEGIETFKLCSADYLFLTGDGSSRDGYDEPAVMKKTCIENYEIDEEKIKTDIYGLSTYDSILNAKKNGAEKIIIITQSYHMPRALYIAKSLGMEAYGVQAHLLRYKAQIIWSAREVLARNKDFLKCIL